MSNIVNKDFCFSSCTKECTDFLIEKATNSLLEILDKAETTSPEKENNYESD